MWALFGGTSFALDVEADGFGVGEAFLFEDSCGEGVGGVGGEDGDFLLEEDGAGVVGVVGEVDGAAGFFFAGGEDGLVDVVAVHAFAAVLSWAAAGGRKQRGVDVEDAAGEVVGDLPKGEEAGHECEVDAVVPEDVGDAFGEGFEGAGVFAGDDVDGEVEVLGALDAFAGGVAGDDAGDLGVEFFAGDDIGEVLEGGAAAGDEDAEAEGHGRPPAGWERLETTESQRAQRRTEG